MKKRAGFTLIELLVVISIIALLSSIVLSSLASARAKSRDAKRIAELKQIETALYMYALDKNTYPGNTASTEDQVAQPGGFDTDVDNSFIDQLTSSGYIPKIKDASKPWNYGYYHYSAGEFGCPVDRGGYYVLYIKDLESVTRTSDITGQVRGSEGFKCGTTRDWQSLGDVVIGRFIR